MRERPPPQRRLELMLGHLSMVIARSHGADVTLGDMMVCDPEHDAPGDDDYSDLLGPKMEQP